MIKSGVGRINLKVLSNRLKELEDSGMVVRKVTPGRPVQIEYSLTEKGRDKLRFSFLPQSTRWETVQRWSSRTEILHCRRSFEKDVRQPEVARNSLREAGQPPTLNYHEELVGAIELHGATRPYP